MLTTFCFLLCIVNLFVKQCGVYKVGRMSCGAKLFSVKPAFCSCEYLNSREFSVQFWSVLRFTASDNLLSMLKIFLSYVCLMPLICQQFSVVLILFLLLVKEVEISNESKWPAASYWQTYGKRIENTSPWVASDITTLASRSHRHGWQANSNLWQVDINPTTMRSRPRWIIFK